ncbi:MAG: HEAT repeat domain-containing protein [Gammaproteobacteria bacterium]
MKRHHSVAALILAASLASCSQDAPEENQKSPTKPKETVSSPKKHNPVNEAMPVGSTAGRGGSALADKEILRLLREKQSKGEGPAGILDHRLGLLKGRNQLSEEEIRKNREIAARRQEQLLAEARKNIDSQDERLRLRAVSHLDTSDANDLMLLENALRLDSSPEIREEAAVQLSDGDPKVAVPALLNALADHEPDVAIAAIESLGMIEGGDKSEIEAAIKNIERSHQNEDVREAAQQALEDM